MTENPRRRPRQGLARNIRKHRVRPPQPDAEVDEYTAPIHFRTMKRVAEASSNAPRPASDSVIAVKSPRATPPHGDRNLSPLS